MSKAKKWPEEWFQPTWVPIPVSVLGYDLRIFAKRLGCKRAEALGYLTALWLWAAKGNADSDGHLLYASERDIAGVFSELSGEHDPVAVVRALVDSGWIEKEGEEYYLADWNHGAKGR